MPPGRRSRVTVSSTLHELLVPALARGLAGQRDRDVGGQCLEPADLDHLHAGVAGRVVELGDHAPHEGDLAGEVDVVGAPRLAGRDHGAPVEGVRADEVQHHPCPRGQLRERFLVLDVRGQRRRRLGTLRREHRAQLLCVASGGRPAGARLGRAVGEIGRDAPPGDAGRPEDDDV
jgi:hypothetical protein